MVKDNILFENSNLTPLEKTAFLSSRFGFKMALLHSVQRMVSLLEEIDLVLSDERPGDEEILPQIREEKEHILQTLVDIATLQETCFGISA